MAYRSQIGSSIHEIIYPNIFYRGYTGMLSEEFVIHFSELEDPRVTNHNSKHTFEDIFILAFVANLCCCDSWVEVEEFCKSREDFFKEFLDLKNGIPSHDTFGRVFSMIDSTHLEMLLIDWMSKIFKKSNGEIIAIDGKTIRGSRRKGELSGISMINAWACENKLSLGSIKVDDGSNEISGISKMLDYLDIKKCTITIDAIGCQTKIADKIINNGANYILCVKNNQKRLKGFIESHFDNHIKRGKSRHISDTGVIIEKAHGREESRQILCLPSDDVYKLQESWPHAKSVIKVIRKRVVNEKLSEQVNYYISSHSFLSIQITHGIRKHWNIENCLHWQLDVSFGEDGCRARVKNAANNLAVLRRLSLAFIKLNTSRKGSMKIKRKLAGWDNDFLKEVLIDGISKFTGEKKL